jgi:hypothetical protein
MGFWGGRSKGVITSYRANAVLTSDSWDNDEDCTSRTSLLYTMKKNFGSPSFSLLN